MKRYLLKLLLVTTLFSYSCIGTDILDIEIFDPEVRIVSQVLSMELDTDYQFMASYFNEFGMEEVANIEWSSSDDAILSISQDGLAHSEAIGAATVTATSGILTDAITVIVDMELTNTGDRTGSFMGLSGYNVAGDFALNMVDDELKLEFMENFVTAQGPGLYVYMSNLKDGVAGATELGPVKSVTGAQTYDVPEGVEMLTYQYILIYCKPFGVGFGLGEFD